METRIEEDKQISEEQQSKETAKKKGFPKCKVVFPLYVETDFDPFTKFHINFLNIMAY